MNLVIASYFTINRDTYLKVKAGKSVEALYKSIVLSLREEEGQDREVTQITFSTGLQVKVKRELHYQEEESSEYEESDTFDILDYAPTKANVKFRELSRSKIEELEVEYEMSSEVFHKRLQLGFNELVDNTDIVTGDEGFDF
ncbi:hypothetical protein CEW46_27475 [Bacillus cereus]|nr:hypothetical protein CEW46_27475 [Bacillus cereus]